MYTQQSTFIMFNFISISTAAICIDEFLNSQFSPAFHFLNVNLF